MTDSKWRDISDPAAPISGSFSRERQPVLLWVPGGGYHSEGAHATGVIVMTYKDEREAVADGYGGDWKITKWQPLPEPPEADE